MRSTTLTDALSFLIVDDHPMTREALGQFAGAEMGTMAEAQAAIGSFIVVSAARKPVMVRLALDFGASAYIDKSVSMDEIARIVRAVLTGEIFAPPEAGPADSSPPSSRRSNGAG